MTKAVERELHAILYGEEPYERYRAPELEVFIELVPLLPESLLQLALYHLLSIGIKTQNQHELLFARFKQYFPEDKREELINEWVGRSRYYDVAPAWKPEDHTFNVNLRDEIEQKVQEPLQIVGILEKIEAPTQQLEEELFSDYLRSIFDESYQRGLFSDFQRDPLIGLIRLIQSLPELERESLYRHILSSLFSEKSHASDDRILMEILPLIPTSLDTWVESVARFLHREWVLTIMHEIRNIPIESFKPYQSPIYKYLGQRAYHLLQSLPDEDKIRILRSVLDELWNKYAGAPPPPLRPSRFELWKSMPPLKSEPKTEVFYRDYQPQFEHGILTEEGLREKLPFKPSLPARMIQTERIVRKKRAVVNVGFADPKTPEEHVDRHLALRAASDYYFWVTIGKKEKGTIDKGRTPILPDLPQKSLLKVVLFPFTNELKLLSGRNVGWMRLTSVNGQISAIVEKRASKPKYSKSGILKHRLFFHVKTPKKPGNYRLRCNVYYEQVLLQSRLVKAHVAEEPRKGKPIALQSIVDYSIGPSLNIQHLNHMQKQDLSIMLNDSGDGTHTFRIFGENDAAFNITLDGQTLESMIKKARETLSRVTWGEETAGEGIKRYRYEGAPTIDEFKNDLILLAKKGWDLYCALSGKFVGEKKANLESIVDKCSQIEFVIRDDGGSSHLIVPIALIYDKSIDEIKKLKVCPNFLEAYGKVSFETVPCFKGDCVKKDDLTIICPKGFWGFRNSLSLPLQRASDIDYLQTYNEAPEIQACAYPKFKEWTEHSSRLRKLVPVDKFHLTEDRDEALERLKKAYHVVYFYCHGETVGGKPFICLGETNETRISPNNFKAYKIKWDNPKPLVFINGCHTTALEPGQILDFVNPLLQECNAAGVIGTEISIYESLATSFAEGCLRRFLKDEKSIGEAVRKTRMELLDNGNPLGLVYVPYVHSGLKLVKKSTENVG